MNRNQYELYHYGVKGMKWGVRRARKKTSRADRKAENAEYKRVKSSMKNIMKKSTAVAVNTNTGMLGAINKYTGEKDVLYIGKEDARRVQKYMKRYQKLQAAAVLGSSSAAIAGYTYLQYKLNLR